MVVVGGEKKESLRGGGNIFRNISAKRQRWSVPPPPPPSDTQRQRFYKANYNQGAARADRKYYPSPPPSIPAAQGRTTREEWRF